MRAQIYSPHEYFTTVSMFCIVLFIHFFLEHYQAFNFSLAHHASLLNHLGATQTQITDTRTSLQEAKDSLGNKRADLVQLWSRGQTLEEMMRLLDQM